MQETAIEQAVTAGEEDFKTLIDHDVAYIDKSIENGFREKQKMFKCGM
ncbi:MAG: hypothetical protein ACI4VX_04540 [Succinivibrionaceae bacterium]